MITWQSKGFYSSTSIYSKIRPSFGSMKIKIDKEWLFRWKYYPNILEENLNKLEEISKDKSLVLFNIKNEILVIREICLELLKYKNNKIIIYVKKEKRKIILYS
jgi:hypothetical protein